MWAMKVCTALLTAYLVVLCVTETYGAADLVDYGEISTSFKKATVQNGDDYFRLDCFEEITSGRKYLVAVLSLEGQTYQVPTQVGSFTMEKEFCKNVIDGENFRVATTSGDGKEFQIGYHAKHENTLKYYVVRVSHGKPTMDAVQDANIGSADDDNWERIPDFHFYHHGDTNYDTISFLLDVVLKDKIQWEKREVSRTSNWDDLKQMAPFGNLPLLKVTRGNFYVSGENSILLYLASRTKLSASDLEEMYKISAVADQLRFIRRGLALVLSETDAAKKAKLAEDFRNVYKPIFQKWNSEIQYENEGEEFKRPYLVNRKLTWVDVDFYTLVESMVTIERNLNLDEYDKLKELRTELTIKKNLPRWT